MHVRKTVNFAIGDQKKIIIVQKYFIDRCVMCAVLIFASLHKNIEICKKKSWVVSTTLNKKSLTVMECCWVGSNDLCLYFLYILKIFPNICDKARFEFD